MAKSFDAAVKDLIERHPADWLRFFGVAATTLHVLDADLSTISAAADKIYRIDEPEPWLLHVEFNSSPRSDPDGHVQWYNSLLRHRHGLPVRSVVVLLRKSANSPKLNGLFKHRLPGESPYLEFRYDVVRLWEQPVERFLTGGAGLAPLAPLAAASDGEVPGIVRQVADCIKREAIADQANQLWTAAYVLTGLRLPEAELTALFQGVTFMSILHDSSAYGAFVSWAKTSTARHILLRQGEIRFGPPPESVKASVEKIEDMGRLERLCDRVLNAASWDELLATP